MRNHAFAPFPFLNGMAPDVEPKIKSASLERPCKVEAVAAESNLNIALADLMFPFL